MPFDLHEVHPPGEARDLYGASALCFQGRKTPGEKHFSPRGRHCLPGTMDFLTRSTGLSEFTLKIYVPSDTLFSFPSIPRHATQGGVSGAYLEHNLFLNLRPFFLNFRFAIFKSYTLFRLVLF